MGWTPKARRDVLTASLGGHLRRYVKRQFPRVTARLRPVVDSVLAAVGRDDARVRRWLATGADLARTVDLRHFVFDADGVWIRDRAGTLWSYRPAVGTFGLSEGGLWEPGEVAVLRDHLNEGGVFLDVGANIGAFAVELARTVDDLEVHAFEPATDPREALVANAAKNGVADRVHVSACGLLDRAGRVRITRGLQGLDHVVLDAGAKPGTDTETVDVTTLDAYVESTALARVDAIKIDVEGAELFVLEGARATLARDQPLLLVEVEGHWTRRFGHEPTAVFDLLTGLGYRHRRMEEWRLEPSTGDIGRDLELSSNFVFSVDD